MQGHRARRFDTFRILSASALLRVQLLERQAAEDARWRGRMCAFQPRDAKDADRSRVRRIQRVAHSPGEAHHGAASRAGHQRAGSSTLRSRCCPAASLIFERPSGALAFQSAHAATLECFHVSVSFSDLESPARERTDATPSVMRAAAKFSYVSTPISRGFRECQSRFAAAVIQSAPVVFEPKATLAKVRTAALTAQLTFGHSHPRTVARAQRQSTGSNPGGPSSTRKRSCLLSSILRIARGSMTRRRRPLCAA